MRVGLVRVALGRAAAALGARGYECARTHIDQKALRTDAPMPDGVPTGREGPIWGHAVSHDMVHWAHVPVGVWNGAGWYDMHGLFTGSAVAHVDDGRDGPAI